MVVRVGYGVDQGTVQYDRDPFGYGGFGSYGDPFYRGYRGYRGVYSRPYYSRWGWYGARSPFYYGWDSPFGSPFGYGGGVTSYTVYRSHLDLDIRRKADNAALFEGRARARSHNDNLGRARPQPDRSDVHRLPGALGRDRPHHRRPAAARALSGGLQIRKKARPERSGRAFFYSALSELSLRAGESAGGCRRRVRCRSRAAARSA